MSSGEGGKTICRNCGATLWGTSVAKCYKCKFVIGSMTPREEEEFYKSWGCLFGTFIIGIAFVALPIIDIYYLGSDRRGSKGPGAAIIVGGVILVVAVCRVIAKISRSISDK